MMGTKRAFDEDLHEFIKHPKHLDFGHKPALVAENKFPLETFQVDGIAGENVTTAPNMVFKEFEISAPLPLVTGVDTGEDDSGPGSLFSSNLLSEFFEYNFPRRQLFHYDDIYSSLLNRSPRKDIPIGSNHQADVPEFDSELAKKYRENGEMDRFLGDCVISIQHFNIATSSDIQMGCECLDCGSIRCVQQHVNEARMNLRKSYGNEKFVELGMLDMGEEVACRWSADEEQLFHQVVYSNPASLGRMFWKELSIAFPSRTKKELVSYYFNVFILHRRAVQNRSQYLDIDSDDDEWRGSYGGTYMDRVEDDFVVSDHDSSSEDSGVDANYDDSYGDLVIGFDDQPLEPNTYTKAGVKSSVIMNDNKVTTEGDQENCQLRSENGFQKGLDPPAHTQHHY